MTRSPSWRTAVLAFLASGGLYTSAALAAPPEIYWTNLTTDTIQRANLDGSGVATLEPGVSSIGVAVDVAGGKIYWTDLGNPNAAGDESIRRANLDGSVVEVLVDNADGLSSPSDIELDQATGKIYWTDGGSPAGRISRANLDGSAVELIFNVLDHRALNFGSGPGQTLEFAAVWGLALDTANGDIYWTDFFGADIHRAKLDGSGVSGPLVTGLGTPRGITVDVAVGQMYWTDSLDSTVSRAALNGSNVQLVASDLDGVDTPFDVEIDAIPGKLYWTNNGSGEIQRADFDGQNVEALVVLPGQDLTGLSIAPTPPPTPVPMMHGLGLAVLAILLGALGGRSGASRSRQDPHGAVQAWKSKTPETLRFRGLLSLKEW